MEPLEPTTELPLPRWGLSKIEAGYDCNFKNYQSSLEISKLTKEPKNSSLKSDLPPIPFTTVSSSHGCLLLVVFVLQGTAVIVRDHCLCGPQDQVAWMLRWFGIKAKSSELLMRWQVR